MIVLGCKDPVAFCRKHKCCLSVKQMKMKGCLQKQCWHLSRLEHKYWEHRDFKKARAKLKKEKRKQQIEQLQKGETNGQVQKETSSH